MTVLHQSKMTEPERDEIDRLPGKDRATNWDIAGFIISILSHLVDVAFDCNLAFQYYRSGEMPYFLATLVFILLPAFINTAFSIRMYVLDQDNKNKNATLTKRLTKKGLCYLIVLVFQLAPVLRYFDALQYAIKSKKAMKRRDYENQRKYYELMVKEDSDVALLRVLECFLEAAPQQILQLSIIFYTNGVDFQDTFYLFHQLLSIGSSFVSMAWSMASYQRLLRVSLKNKNNISWPGTIMQFLWHFTVTVSRILCISVIASVYPKETIVVLTVHWFLMIVWISFSSQQNSYCRSKIYDMFFYTIFGAVYIFTHVVLVEGPTFCKYTIFYTILFAENMIANIVWTINAEETIKASIYYIPVICLNIVPFVFGIMFMIAYYKFFHPSTGYHRQFISSS